MRIGLNVSIARQPLAGIGTYAFQLARHLPAVAPDIEWVFFGPETGLFADSDTLGAQVVHRRDPLARILWEQTILPVAARGQSIDLLHGADFSRPLAYCGRTINTVHDLSPYADVRFFPLPQRIYKKTLIPFAMRTSHAIITVSEFSRKQVLTRFPFLEGRVFAVPLGVEASNPCVDSQRDRPFLLFVGTLEHRKNVVALVNAFRIVRERRQIPHRLVLVGQPGYGYQMVRSAIVSARVSDAVDVLGYTDKAEVARLYRSASLFVYPSLYEGFGLPVLEAMASGSPVACSNAASLPEVGGDAVAYFDPKDVEEMSYVIERVLDSPTLQAELRAKGFRQSSKFTWQECARKHLDVYRMVLS